MVIFHSYVSLPEGNAVYVLDVCLGLLGIVTGKTQQPGRHDNFGPGVATTRQERNAAENGRTSKTPHCFARDQVVLHPTRGETGCTIVRL